jgi:hypothetical protein
MSDLSRLRIWREPAIRGALSWYLDVAENRRPAKFRIAATVPAGRKEIVPRITRAAILRDPRAWARFPAIQLASRAGRYGSAHPQFLQKSRNQAAASSI